MLFDRGMVMISKYESHRNKFNMYMIDYIVREMLVFFVLNCQRVLTNQSLFNRFSTVLWAMKR